LIALQALAPVVQGADDVKRMQLLSSLRDTILPLSEVIMSRLGRVTQFETNELAPLAERAKAANHTIQVRAYVASIIDSMPLPLFPVVDCIETK
jgi:hypothetical protein